MRGTNFNHRRNVTMSKAKELLIDQLAIARESGNRKAEAYIIGLLNPPARGCWCDSNNPGTCSGRGTEPFHDCQCKCHKN